MVFFCFCFCVKISKPLSSNMESSSWIFLRRNLWRKQFAWITHTTSPIATHPAPPHHTPHHLSHHNPPRTPTPHPTPPLPPQPTPHPHTTPHTNWLPSRVRPLFGKLEKLFCIYSTTKRQGRRGLVAWFVTLTRTRQMLKLLRTIICSFSCGLSLEGNSSNHTGASFSMFHR